MGGFDSLEVDLGVSAIPAVDDVEEVESCRREQLELDRRDVVAERFEQPAGHRDRLERGRCTAMFERGAGE